MKFALKEIQKQAITSLQTYYSISESETMAFWLLENLFGVSKSDILLNKEVSINTDMENKLQEYLKRLSLHEPIQYILGESYFCGRKFEVNSSVLIPRPETEELVEYICQHHKQTPPQQILDVGTGSGCIAISLALFFPEAAVTAIDISEKALEVAQRNTNNLGAKVNFLQENALEYKPQTSWDMIVSNPPYIKEVEKQEMKKNVLDYEPHLALFVEDNNPLLFYKAIAQIASRHLNENGYLYFEINEALAKETAHELKVLAFENVEIIKDFYGKDRFVKAQYKSSKFMSK